MNDEIIKDSLTLPEIGAWVKLDDGTTGFVRWVGIIPRGNSVWVGIELDSRNKKGGNGSLKGNFRHLIIFNFQQSYI